VILANGVIAIGALIAISACMSLMFPTIYGIALEGVSPADTKLGASGLIMAILGGALLTPMQALISDTSGSISVSFTIPLICFIIIVFYANYAIKSK
jgi:FHS family L-fucose permease-like MFS transporter